MNGAQTVAEMLRAYGVKYVFGVPGDTSIPFYEALYQAKADITHVLSRDERSAGYMADVYARVSYQPGVCEAPSGAGVTYLAPGIAEANASSIPVIAITTDVPLQGEGRGVLTEIDQRAVMEPVTKWRTVVKRADKVPEIMRRAFRAATTGRPGAVHICLPEDVQEGDAGVVAIYAEDACRSYPAHRTRPDADAIWRAAELLLAAHRPVLVAGGAAVTSQAWPEITALAEMLDMPVGTSINGKGSIVEDHPLSLGVVGGNGGKGYSNAFVAEADLVLFVGCRTDSVTTANWRLPRPGVTVIHVDVDPFVIGNNYPTAVGLVGDPKLALADLLAEVRRLAGDPHPPPHNQRERGARVPRRGSPQPLGEGLGVRAREIAARSAPYWAEFAAKAASNAMPIKPQRVVQALVELLPPDAIVIADAGTPTPFIAGYFRVKRPGRRVIIPRGYGGLGYAIPGVVGAKLAEPQTTVVGLCGDGSFGMAAGEFETIARLGLPVTIIQFNNGCFGWIKTLQHLYRSGRYLSVDFSPDTDYVAVAAGFGVPGVRVERPEELLPTLQTALSSGKPAFVDVVTEPEMTEVPPVEAWLAARERI